MCILLVSTKEGGWERVSPTVRTFLFINLGFEATFLVVQCNVEFSHHIRTQVKMSMTAFSRDSVKFYDVFNIEHQVGRV